MPQKILVVEDNELNMKLFCDLLTVRGYEVIRAVDGSVGLALAEQEMPDLILMDIQLPKVSGLEVTKLLKADRRLRHIPVIGVTAYAMKGDEQRIRDAGCEDYMSKPISVGPFLETIRKHLDAAANQHCCRGMNDAINGWTDCTLHATPFDCADALVVVRRDGSYGIIVHDGGTSSVTIAFCPFCGAHLPRGEASAPDRSDEVQK